jgi:hypothetical protein
MAQSLSAIGQLPTLCGMDAVYPDSRYVPTCATALALYGNQLYRFDQDQGLPQPPYLHPQGV